MYKYKILRSLRSFKNNLNSSFAYCTQTNTHGKLEKVETLFINSEVQKILQKITGLDYERIFAVSKKPLEPHKYEFVTDKRLKELQEQAAQEARRKLQMPPVMTVRVPINEVLAKDPELQGYLKHKVMFTDISPSASHRDRQVTVREIDGTLRKASWEERDRMNQIFYPTQGRHLEMPKMFESPYLEHLFEEGSYKFILDSACLQFEPDHPDYHRVTKATYEHLKSTMKFDDLRSTRHFGPMAFYFAYTNNIDHLLVDMIQRNLLSDAADTIKLLYIMHEELSSSDIDENDHILIIEDYIENHATHKDDLQFVMRTTLEQNSSSSTEISS